MANYCGCLWYDENSWLNYLPQVYLKAHATILSSVSRTTLTQTFINPSNEVVKEISYQFPLYDGVSVVGFECKVGSRMLHSKVKAKSQANTDYQHAVAQHQTAAIMDHTSENDVFLIRLGNVPAQEKVHVDITFVGELKQDTQTDGNRYTLPSSIAPRYRTQISYNPGQLPSMNPSANLQGISITVDVQMEKGLVLRELESPSHRVKVSLRRISSTPPTSPFEPSQASASIVPLANQTSVVLEHDFIILIKADELDTPSALLETHPIIPNQRALMANLVPKFNLQPASPEVVFVIDRSGSMEGKITTLQTALCVFLKSLPVGVCFNICSFGSGYSFMWPKSKVYNSHSLEQALGYVKYIRANMGGTEMEQAVVAAVGNRLDDRDLELLILTDGQIYDQQSLFNFIRERAADHRARFFSLGIGNEASHSLVEGIARSGNGFSQSVVEYEELDRKVVRMLKGALTPHIYDYKLEVEYDVETESEFEFMSDSATPVESEKRTGEDRGCDSAIEHIADQPLQPISLFDTDFQEPELSVDAGKRANAGLPTLTPPEALQAPYKIATLYPFIRTNVFLLMDPHSTGNIPTSLKLSATSAQGPLQLRIPITDIGTGQTIHQLASRKAMIELEEKHGWLSDAKDEKGNSFNQFFIETQQRLVERECQNLGVKFQVTGKHCSFVALEEPSSLSPAKENKRSPPKEHTVEQFPRMQGPQISTPQCAYTGVSSYPVSRPLRGGGPSAASTAIPDFSALSMQMSTPPLAPAGGTGGWGYNQSSPQGNQRYRSAFAGSSRIAHPPLNQEKPEFDQAQSIQRSQRASLCQLQCLPAPGPTSFSAMGPSTGSPQPFFGQRSPFAAVPDGMYSSIVVPSYGAHQPSRVHEIIRLQEYSGCWKWSPALFEQLEFDMTAKARQIEALCATNGFSVDLSSDELIDSVESEVLATALTMGWLRNRNANSRDLWELVYAKAEQWIMRTKQDLQKKDARGAAIAITFDQIMDLM